MGRFNPSTPVGTRVVVMLNGIGIPRKGAYEGFAGRFCDGTLRYSVRDVKTGKLMSVSLKNINLDSEGE
jgi:hypothetical protein